MIGISNIWQTAKAKFGFLSLLLALTVMSKAAGFGAVPDAIIVVVALLCVLNETSHGEIHIWATFACFLLYLPINIIVSNPDPCFRSWERFLYFSLLMFAISPIIRSKFAISFRAKVLNTVIIISFVISFASFFCYFLGINLMSREDVYFAVVEGMSGTFSGIANHSMILGPLSGISVIALYSKWWESKKWAFILLMLPCVGSLLLAASRSALLACLGGLLIMIYMASKKKIIFIRTLLVVLFLAMLSFPLWKPFTEGMTKKQEARTEAGGTFDSRTDKVEARCYEFTESPLFGVGFTSILPSSGDAYDKKTGTIEPGTSWLFVLSSTGLIGFTFFLFIAYRSLRRTLKSQSMQKILMLGLIAFICIHLLVEGYIFSPGSPLCFVTWLILGRCYDIKGTVE